jgi:hypothetical protein
LFDEQRPLSATKVTRTYEWRVEQLDRMARMISDHEEEFRKAMAIRVMTVAMQTLAGQNSTGPPTRALADTTAHPTMAGCPAFGPEEERNVRLADELTAPPHTVGVHDA